MELGADWRAVAVIVKPASKRLAETICEDYCSIGGAVVTRRSVQRLGIGALSVMVTVLMDSDAMDALADQKVPYQNSQEDAPFGKELMLSWQGSHTGVVHDATAACAD
jgi:hypothetical protein